MKLAVLSFSRLTLPPALLALGALLSPVASAADFLKGDEAFWEGSYSAALQEFEPLAEQGHAGAQNRLGDFYLGGLIVAKDYDQALKWYRRAAEQGDANAQENLGYMYHRGKGVSEDFAEALKWYRLAAEHGNASAAGEIAEAYDSGMGVPEDVEEAAKWYRRAAAIGHLESQYILGLIYLEPVADPSDPYILHFWRRTEPGWYNKSKLSVGDAEKYLRVKGIPKDNEKAFRVFSFAAEHGHTAAQVELAAMYAAGRGVERDEELAAAWYLTAAAAGNLEARESLALMYAKGLGVSRNFVRAHVWWNLSGKYRTGKATEVELMDLEEVMSPEEIEEAKKLARKWSLALTDLGDRE